MQDLFLQLYLSLVTGSHCVALAAMELRHVCLSLLLSTGVEALRHYAQSLR